MPGTKDTPKPSSPDRPGLFILVRSGEHGLEFVHNTKIYRSKDEAVTEAVKNMLDHGGKYVIFEALTAFEPRPHELPQLGEEFYRKATLHQSFGEIKTNAFGQLTTTGETTIKYSGNTTT